MPEALVEALNALAALRPGDRRAVLRRLSPEQRKLLERSRVAKSAAAPASKPARASMPSCSFWLAKRLGEMAAVEECPHTTPAARAAVRTFMLTRSAS